jgi:hypothetical protein
MTTFTFYWLDGRVMLLEGHDAANAMSRAGYGAGAMRALDFYSHGDTRANWEFINGHWDRPVGFHARSFEEKGQLAVVEGE